MTDFTTNYQLALPDFDVSGWHEDVNGNFSLIDSILFAFTGLADFVGEWTNSTNYTEGQRVFDPENGTIWNCLVDHTSASTGTFEEDRDDHPTYWSAVNSIPQSRGQWDNEVVYSLGDLVYDANEGIFGQANVTHTSSASPATMRTDIANFDVISDIDSFLNPATSAKTANFTIVSTDRNRLFTMDPTSAAVTATLPSLASGDAGWECFFIKIGSSTNPCFIAPASGTLQSGDQTGLSKTRRSVPGKKFSAYWTGTAWIIERCVNAPIGSLIPNALGTTTPPVGYEFPNGTSLSSSANYPDYYAKNSNSLAVPDVTGRAIFGLESSATRLTTAGSSIDGATKGATGGAQNKVLVEGNMPSLSSGNVSASLTAGSHTHGAGSFAVGTSVTVTNGSNQIVSSGGIGSGYGGTGTGGAVTVTAALASGAVSGTSGGNTASVTGTISYTGTATAVNIMNPAIVLPYYMVVE